MLLHHQPCALPLVAMVLRAQPARAAGREQRPEQDDDEHQRQHVRDRAPGPVRGGRSARPTGRPRAPRPPGRRTGRRRRRPPRPARRSPNGPRGGSAARGTPCPASRATPLPAADDHRGHEVRTLRQVDHAEKTSVAIVAIHASRWPRRSPRAVSRRTTDTRTRVGRAVWITRPGTRSRTNPIRCHSGCTAAESSPSTARRGPPARRAPGRAPGAAAPRGRTARCAAGARCRPSCAQCARFCPARPSGCDPGPHSCRARGGRRWSAPRTLRALPAARRPARARQRRRLDQLVVDGRGPRAAGRRGRRLGGPPTPSRTAGRGRSGSARRSGCSPRSASPRTSSSATCRTSPPRA